MMNILIRYAAVALCVGLVGAQASAQDTSIYVERGSVLSPGTLRLDIGPPDFALLDSGILVNGYGLRFFDRLDHTNVRLGIGLAVGVAQNLEIGALILPITFFS